ncbi:MAG: hypothetical protein K6E51_08590 [Treponema sp.]|nr:hypothetical protein [Treponema sp.]
MAESHWTEEKEVGGTLPLFLLLTMVRIFPSWLLRLIAAPISFFYYLFVPRAREFCRIYQKQLYSFYVQQDKVPVVKRLHIYRQIYAFALAIVEKVQGWSGHIFLKNVHFQDDDVQNLIATLEQKKGVLVITSHLGNVEMLRSLMGYNRTAVNRTFPVITIGNITSTKKFNAVLERINPQYDMTMITSETIGPGTIIQLQEKLASGAMVVLAGDRTSESTQKRVIEHDFLGKKASFPYGVYLLAALLQVPVYFIFSLRKKDTSLVLDYDMHVHKSTSVFSGLRKERETYIHALNDEFVTYLEKYTEEHPFQWYNFYNFWAK